MEWYEEEVRTIERTHAINPPPHGSTVFYGSSSIRLWTSLTNDFREISSSHVVNLGFGGSTLEACAWFYERLVRPCNPRALIIYAGDNDLGDGQPPDRVVRSFQVLLEKVQQHAPHMRVTFMSIKPSPSRHDLSAKIRETNMRIRREIEQREPGYYVDVFYPMLGSDGYPQRQLYAEDGLHLSPAGYQLWTRVLSLYHQVIF